MFEVYVLGPSNLSLSLFNLPEAWRQPIDKNELFIKDSVSLIDQEKKAEILLGNPIRRD